MALLYLNVIVLSVLLLASVPELQTTITFPFPQLAHVGQKPKRANWKWQRNSSVSNCTYFGSAQPVVLCLFTDSCIPKEKFLKLVQNFKISHLICNGPKYTALYGLPPERRETRTARVWAHGCLRHFVLKRFRHDTLRFQPVMTSFLAAGLLCNPLQKPEKMGFLSCFLRTSDPSFHTI